jgi:hypothetical protein
MLTDYRFILEGGNPLIDLHPIAVRQKKDSPRINRYMLDMNHPELFFSEFSQQNFSVIGSVVDADQLHFPTGKIVILKIHQQ